ncbi:MAG: TlpA disulfide reductase family protein [Polyangiaceae bacterium]
MHVTRPLFLVLPLSLFAACKNEDHPTSAPSERSQAVQAAVPAVTPAAHTASAAPAASAPRAPKPRRALCGGELQDLRALPKKHVSQVGAKLPENLAPDASGFLWVNFWAAWCAPCKEEIPRLSGWPAELAKKGHKLKLAFVSIDDDERQLRQFLDGGALRSSYWLKEGKERDEWLKAAGVDADPELPVHLLVDSRGRIRCKVQGAVEDADLADLTRLLAAGN